MVTNMQALQVRLRQRFGRFCLYQRLRTSPLCDLYRRLSSNGDVIQRRAAELRFYRVSCGGCARVTSFLISEQMEETKWTSFLGWAHVSSLWNQTKQIKRYFPSVSCG